MRLIKTGAVLYVLVTTLVLSGFTGAARPSADRRASALGAAAQTDGLTIFRFDTFGDEQFWTDVLRMHEVIPTVDPTTALEVGLKVDADALPPEIIDALRAGEVDLEDPAITIALIQLDAVVGIKGTVNEAGQLTRVGITCALCHSTVDNSLTRGIGKRLDGWANTDLDVGRIVALSPALDSDTKKVFSKWGPGMYDPRHHYFNGSAIVPLPSPTVPVLIPAIYGLRDVGFETATADGPISYWNAYVGVGQMGGKGDFSDPRLGISIDQEPDLVTPKLAALLEYQFGLEVPAPPPGSFNTQAAARGKALFEGAAGCANCHAGPAFTDVLNGLDPTVPLLHEPKEVGMDPTYARESATGAYRTTPLRALQLRPAYFHDGSAKDLAAVVRHYNQLFRLRLTGRQQADLVEYLKSL